MRLIDGKVRDLVYREGERGRDGLEQGLNNGGYNRGSGRPQSLVKYCVCTISVLVLLALPPNLLLAVTSNRSINVRRR